jgi:putative SOS response-associated peptidase YedK
VTSPGQRQHLHDRAPRVRTFAIITTGFNNLVAEIHDRMPLILQKS